MIANLSRHSSLVMTGIKALGLDGRVDQEAELYLLEPPEPQRKFDRVSAGADIFRRQVADVVGDLEPAGSLERECAAGQRTVQALAEAFDLVRKMGVASLEHGSIAFERAVSIGVGRFSRRSLNEGMVGAFSEKPSAWDA